jgi:hypothetical protein
VCLNIPTVMVQLEGDGLSQSIQNPLIITQV